MGLIVFDFDGTLLDSANTVLKILNLMRVSENKKILQKKDLIPWISLGGRALIRNALELDSESLIDKNLDEFRQIYFEEQSSEGDIYPYALDFIKQLKAADFKLAISTNKPRPLLDKILIELSLSKYFDYCVAGGDLLTQKPNPKNLLICNDVLNISPEHTLLVGDSTVDQNMANAAKIKFCMFSGGYDDGVDISSANAVIFSYQNAFEVIEDIVNTK